jgi:LmeA-like phospholipid-binding
VRKWVFVVLPTVVLLALVVADQAAKGWAESQLAERAATYYPPGAGSSASIHSFPFIPRLLFTGDVPRVDVNLDDLRIQAVLVRRLSLHVADVKLDRDEVFRGRVHVRDVGEGKIVATVDGPSLAKAIGADVRFTQAGDVEVHERIQGVDVKARGKATFKGNVITVTPTSVQGLDVPASRFAITYKIPGVELLPCEAEVKITKDTAVLSCNVVDIPAALVQAAQSGR